MSSGWWIVGDLIWAAIVILTCGVGLRAALRGRPTAVVPTLTRDDATRALYVTLRDSPVSRTVGLSDSVNVDYDDANRPVGVEVLY